MTTRHLRGLVHDLLDGLRSRPGRLALSLFAIAIGSMALALLLCVLAGLHERALRLTRELGVNVVALLPEGTQPLRQEHVDRLRANLPDTAVSAVKHYSVMTRDGATRLQVMATDDELIRIRPWQIVSGRFLDQEDTRVGAYHCVISKPLSERMDWHVGQTLAIHQELFRIVGVIDHGRLSGDPLQETRVMPGENLVIIPHTVHPYWSLNPSDGSQDALYVRVTDPDDLEHVAHRAHALIRDGRDAAPQLSVVTPDSLLARIRHWQRSVRFAAGSIASLCMMLGGITLMTLMIANVQERIPEIGLRRALGASRADVAVLFLAEAVGVTLAAGLIGSAAAHVLLKGLGDPVTFPVVLNLWTFLTPVVVAVGSGAAFSYAPARLASRIVPAQALRNE